MQSRFSDPYLNRFLQPDTIVPSMYNPQNLNRYSYVGNNTINYADPTGHNYDCGPLECPQDMRKDYGDPTVIKKHHHGDHGDDLSGGGDEDNPPKIWQNYKNPWGCGNSDIGYVDSCVFQYTKYISLTLGTTIPNPITASIVGWHITITADQYNQWYFGGGLDAGKII